VSAGAYLLSHENEEEAKKQRLEGKILKQRCITFLREYYTDSMVEILPTKLYSRGFGLFLRQSVLSCGLGNEPIVIGVMRGIIIMLQYDLLTYLLTY
jgi:hypothetical protein